MADRLDPYEDTRPCDCCGAPGALSHGRQEICVNCLAAECDPLDELCRHVELEECEDNACDGCRWCDETGVSAGFVEGDRVRSKGGLAVGTVVEILPGGERARVLWCGGVEDTEGLDLLEHEG